MMECVYPEVAKSASARKEKMKEKTDAKRLLKTDKLPVGALVMIEDVQRRAKSEPFWVGPYSVVEISKAGTYALLDSTGALLKRRLPRHQLKLLALPADKHHARLYIGNTVVNRSLT